MDQGSLPFRAVAVQGRSLRGCSRWRARPVWRGRRALSLRSTGLLLCGGVWRGSRTHLCDWARGCSEPPKPMGSIAEG